MKKILYIFYLLPFVGLGQTTTQNFIKTLVYKEATTTSDSDKANASVTYFDGLGRPIQQIAGKMGNDGKDIITHIEYDGFGRQTKEYLPFVGEGSALDFVTDALTPTLQYYTNNDNVDDPTDNPYSEKFFEPSPLNRVLKQAAPGNAWAGNAEDNNDQTVKFAYLVNSADEVKKLKATATWNGDNAVYDIAFVDDNDYYGAAQLYKTITQDENKQGNVYTTATTSVNLKLNTTEEFKDKEGRVVLKRTYNSFTNTNGDTVNETLDTYYVYDQFGNLTYVLPPLMNGSDANIDNLGYQYKYDSRNRLVEKKLPGKQWEYIVYDTLDRVVATGPAFNPWGDGNTGWMITKYEAFGRVAYTGWIAENEIDSAKREAMQGKSYEVVTKTSSPVYIDNIPVNYTNVGYPTEGMIFLTANYYDNYVFPTAANVPGSVAEQTVSANVKGLPTGSWVRILTNPTSQYLLMEVTTIFYDAKARPIRTYTFNSQSGGYNQADSKLDFTGKPEYTVTRQKSWAADVTVTNRFTYNDQDRLLTETHTITGQPTQLMSDNTYNRLGQLIGKKVGNTSTNPLQQVDYSYNIRGWLTDINNKASLGNDLFAFHITYNNPTNENGSGASVPGLFNGNISETYWKTATDYELRKYSYKYDNLNRLKDATYQKPGETVVNTGSYNESLSYDKNGNITHLNRNGGLDAENGVAIDDLTYTYGILGGNKLLKVVDNSNAHQGFVDINDTGDDYDYDANGNMVSDLNKGITNITYNHLNLPVQINFGTTNKIVYIYDAAGIKKRKTVTEGNTTTRIDYFYGWQYKDLKLQFFPTSEGYVDNTIVGDANNFNYVFQYKDHLGNVRISYTKGTDGNPVIKEENHYYPFGLKHTNYNNSYFEFQNIEGTIMLSQNATNKLRNNYKYNGKELQDELGLNMYAMDARQYDPAIARWVVIDPVISFSMSPYNAFNNNPVFWADPEGTSVIQGNGGTAFTGDDAGAAFSAILQMLKTGEGSFTAKGDVIDISNGGDMKGSGAVFSSEKDAVVGFGINYNALSFEKGEIGTEIYSQSNKSGKKFGYFTPIIGAEASVDDFQAYQQVIDDVNGWSNKSFTMEAIVHTHGTAFDKSANRIVPSDRYFSGVDISNANNYSNPNGNPASLEWLDSNRNPVRNVWNKTMRSWLINPWGEVMLFDPFSNWGSSSRRMYNGNLEYPYRIPQDGVNGIPVDPALDRHKVKN